jgi:hypothetical protein
VNWQQLGIQKRWRIENIPKAIFDHIGPEPLYGVPHHHPHHHNRYSLIILNAGGFPV